MQFMHKEGGGADYLQVGVEIKDSSDTSHPMRRAEVQKIQYFAEPAMDKFDIRVYWGTDHTVTAEFKVQLKYQNKEGEWKTCTTGAIAYSATTKQFGDKFWDCINNKVSLGDNRYFHTEIFLYTDDQDTPTTVEDEAVYKRFLVTMKYPVNNPRVTPGKLPELTGNNMVSF